MPNLICILSFLPLVLGAVILSAVSVRLLLDTLYDMSSGFFYEEDLIGGLFGILFSLVLWKLWSSALGCLL